MAGCFVWFVRRSSYHRRGCVEEQCVTRNVAVIAVKGYLVDGTTASFRNIEIHSLAAIRSSFEPPFSTNLPSRYLIKRACPHDVVTSPSSLNGGKYSDFLFIMLGPSFRLVPSTPPLQQSGFCSPEVRCQGLRMPPATIPYYRLMPKQGNPRMRSQTILFGSTFQHQFSIQVFDQFSLTQLATTSPRSMNSE